MTIIVIFLLLLHALPGANCGLGVKKFLTQQIFKPETKYEVKVFTETILGNPVQKTGKDGLKITINETDNPYSVLKSGIKKLYPGQIIYEMRTASLKEFNPKEKKHIVISLKTSLKAVSKASSSSPRANPIDIYVVLGVHVPVFKVDSATNQMTPLGSEPILLRHPLDDFYAIWGKIKELVDTHFQGLQTDDIRVIKGEKSYPMKDWYINTDGITKLILVQHPEVKETVPVYFLEQGLSSLTPPGRYDLYRDRHKSPVKISTITLKQSSVSLRPQRYVWDALMKDTTFARDHFDISNLYVLYKGKQLPDVDPLGVDYKAIDISTIAAVYFDKKKFGLSFGRYAAADNPTVYKFKKKGSKEYMQAIDLGTYATGKHILKEIRQGILGIPDAILAVKSNGKGLDFIQDDLNVYKTKVYKETFQMNGGRGYVVENMPNFVAFTAKTLPNFSKANVNPGCVSGIPSSRHYPYYHRRTTHKKGKRKYKYHDGHEEEFMEEEPEGFMGAGANDVAGGGGLFDAALASIEDNGFSTESPIEGALGSLSFGSMDLGDLEGDFGEIDIEPGSFSEGIGGGEGGDIGGGDGGGGGGDGGGGDGGGGE